MRSFDTLTSRGRLRRLMPLALAALARYPIDAQALRPLAEHTNALFRVDAMDGTRYVLRVCAPGEHDARDRDIEVMWMNALARDRAVKLPMAVAASSGEWMTVVETAGVPEPRTCMLFSWVPGKPIGDDFSPASYRLLGETSARLHAHASTQHVPPELRPMVWDRAFYFVHEPTVVYAASHAHLFTLEQVEAIRSAECMVNAAIAELFRRGQDGPMLIHGDLHPDNVHVHRGTAWMLDLEDLMWGFPTQDIAVSLYQARVSAGDGYSALGEAFRTGYERVRAWPASDVQLETFFTARTLMFINYCANKSAEPDMAAFLPRLMKRIEKSRPERS